MPPRRLLLRLALAVVAVVVETSGSALAGPSSQTGASLSISPQTVHPPAAILEGIDLNPRSVTGGTQSQGTVTLSSAAPSGGVSVSLSSNSSSASVPGWVTVHAGEMSAAFVITTVPVVVSTPALIRATLGPNSHGDTLTVMPAAAPSPTLSSLSLNPASLVGGSSSQATVALSGAAPAGGLSLALSSSASAATVPASVTVPAGSSSASFTVSTAAVSSSVSAAIGAGLGGSTVGATLVVWAVAPPPPPSGAQLFVSTSGSDSGSCSQSAPCASFDRAYQLARPGDTVEVAAGSYGAQRVLKSSPAKVAPAVLFRAAAGANVVVAGIALGTNNGSASGTSPSYVSFDGFEIRGRFTTVYPCLCPPVPSNITLQNSWVHAWNSVGGAVELDDVANARIANNQIGPICCQSDAIETGLRPGSANPQNMLIEGNYVHDLFDSCSAATNFAGQCQGSGYGDGCATCDHIDGFQASGLDGLTIRNNRFSNAGTQAIFLAPANGGSYSNITLENNMVGSVNNGGNNDVSLSGPCLGCYSGTILIRNNTVQKVLVLYAAADSQRVFAPGTSIKVVNNIIGEYSSSSSGRNCSLTYSDGTNGSITYSHNLFSYQTCGPTDTRGTATYVNPNPATPDLHLAPGSLGIDTADPNNYPQTDIDGATRPKGAGPDIGAAER
jgi:hypothetical protein